MPPLPSVQNQVSLVELFTFKAFAFGGELDLKHEAD
jgi:hypothetical protein